MESRKIPWFQSPPPSFSCFLVFASGHGTKNYRWSSRIFPSHAAWHTQSSAPGAPGAPGAPESLQFSEALPHMASEISSFLFFFFGGLASASRRGVPKWMVFPSFKGFSATFWTKTMDVRLRRRTMFQSFLDSGRVSWWSFHPAVAFFKHLWQWQKPQNKKERGMSPADWLIHGSLNVPIFHITQPWSVLMVFFMATVLFLVMSNSPKSWDSDTNPCDFHLEKSGDPFDPFGAFLDARPRLGTLAHLDVSDLFGFGTREGHIAWMPAVSVGHPSVVGDSTALWWQK